MLYHEISLEGMKELQAALAIARPIVLEELERAVEEADLLIEREVGERAPVGAGGAAGFKGSLFHTREVSDMRVIGVVSTSVSHAAPVELGTRPHFPPVDALIDWVKAKFGVSSEKQARGIAFLVARKISIRGTKGQFPFERTFHETDAQVGEIFQAAGKRITDRLGKGSA